jgi:uncharacterized membrane protein YeaQ/YmgE (transglycosylase-associated protein family)
MTLLELIVLLIIAGLAGSIGQAIAGYTRGGCLVSIAVGFIGAIIGVWLARNLGLPTLFVMDVGGADFPVLWSIMGSALFVAVVSLFARGRW